MKLLRVKPSQIKVPEVRVTAQFDQETRDLLRQSISETGIVNPILVQKIEEDLVLIDGLHRLEDVVASGTQLIDVVVLEGDMADLLCRNLFLDHLRGKTPVSDMVRVIGALSEDYGLDPDKIREKTGLTRDYIEKLIKISLASQSVREALDQGVIGVGHAFELSRLPYAIQQEEILAKHQVWRFSVKELKEQIDGVLREMQAIKEQPAEAAPSEPRPAPVYRCEGCNQ
ncbi:MAG: ParB/RepB/Spo0J family partition protein, partial [Gammaproteobacteria bacterium]|nr:ParB/RepB/Spo0J family partition protein [Gammaproteobacteria bacterium]